MTSGLEDHDAIKSRITNAQKELEKLDDTNPLLNFVKVRHYGIHYSAEFISHYKCPLYAGLERYITDLEAKIKEYRSK